MDKDANKEIVKAITNVKKTAANLATVAAFETAMTAERDNRPLYKSCDQTVVELKKTVLAAVTPTAITVTDLDTTAKALSTLIG
jgi:hypothetical protein